MRPSRPTSSSPTGCASATPARHLHSATGSPTSSSRASRVRPSREAVVRSRGISSLTLVFSPPAGAAAYDKSEDPIYVLENNIPIDTKYYLDNQLSKPLMRIFEPILGDKANSLLAGEHTRTISIATPTIGGLMKFAVRTVTCLGCKTPLKTANKGPSKPTCAAWQAVSALTRRPGPLPRWRRLPELPAADRRALPEAAADDVAAPGQLLAALDPVPALPGLAPPGRPVLEQGLPHLLHARQGAEGCRRRHDDPRPLRPREGVVSRSISIPVPPPPPPRTHSHAPVRSTHTCTPPTPYSF